MGGMEDSSRGEDVLLGGMVGGHAWGLRGRSAARASPNGRRRHGIRCLTTIENLVHSFVVRKTPSPTTGRARGTHGRHPPLPSREVRADGGTLPSLSGIGPSLKVVLEQLGLAGALRRVAPRDGQRRSPLRSGWSSTWRARPSSPRAPRRRTLRLLPIGPQQAPQQSGRGVDRGASQGRASPIPGRLGHRGRRDHRLVRADRCLGQRAGRRRRPRRLPRSRRLLVARPGRGHPRSPLPPCCGGGRGVCPGHANRQVARGFGPPDRTSGRSRRVRDRLG